MPRVLPRYFSNHTCHKYSAVLGRSVTDSLGPRGLWPARLLCPWDSPGKSTGVGCHALLQGLSALHSTKPVYPVEQLSSKNMPTSNPWNLWIFALLGKRIFTKVIKLRFLWWRDLPGKALHPMTRVFVRDTQGRFSGSKESLHGDRWEGTDVAISQGSQGCWELLKLEEGRGDDAPELLVFGLQPPETWISLCGFKLFSLCWFVMEALENQYNYSVFPCKRFCPLFPFQTKLPRVIRYYS